MQFGNNISSDETHSNQYAAGTASDQSFTERQQIEANRSAIQPYKQSRLAQNFAPREYVHPKPRRSTPTQARTRQEMNAIGGPIVAKSIAPPAQSNFREPPARNYNPYG